ncbi:MAG: CarD family transcriptional regulator, partial [Verrucomicrobiales bacterium]
MLEIIKANSTSELIRYTSASKPFQDKLKQIGDGITVFNHITTAAQPYVCSLIAEQFFRQSDRRLWILTDNLNTQELLTEGIELWYEEPLFFPDIESVSSNHSLPDQERHAERMSVLKTLESFETIKDIIIILEKSLNEEVSSPESINSNKIKIEKGQKIEMNYLVNQFVSIGYEKDSIVTERGQFSIRGGIIDVFPIQSLNPYRIEFFGDEVDSIRIFEVDSQTSIKVVDSFQILSGIEDTNKCKLKDYINDDDLILKVGSNDGKYSVIITNEPDDSDTEEDFSTACFESPFGSFDAGEFILQQARFQNFKKTLSEWYQKKWRAFIFFKNEGELERFNELANDLDVLPVSGYLETGIGSISHGFIIPSAKLAILSSSEIFGRYESIRSRRKIFNREKRDLNRRRADDFRELNLGDRVVHMDQGIGIFRGLLEIETDGEKPQEVLVIEYEDEAKLYVPLEQAHLVSRY